MAVIGKIRQRSGLLVVVIGVALAAFVLGDFARSSKRPTPNIGVINGENISIQDFNRKFDEQVENTRQQRGEDRLSQDELFRIRESTWSQLVQQQIMDEEYKKLGLVLTAEELFEQVQGPDPHQAIIQNFTDPETGQYNRDLVINYLQNLDNMGQAAKNQWIVFERYIKDDRLRTKYQTLVSRSYHMPKAFAQLLYHEKNDKAELEFAAIRYSNLSDTLVSLTDADYKAFYDQHKKTYDREAQRDIEYLVFEVKASEEDMEHAKEYVESLIDELRLTQHIESFVNNNSETPYNPQWFGKGEVSPAIEELMFEAEPGFVYGPYFEDDNYKIARLVDTDYRSDSLKASHILIAYSGALRSEQSRSVAEAKSLADSLLAVVQKRPTALEELAREFSDDSSVEMNSGDLGWFQSGQMVAPFEEFVVGNPVGSIGLVETDFGFHIIKVTDKNKADRKIQLAIITREASPSSLTYQHVFSKASKFAAENKTLEQFNQTIEDEGLNKRIAPALRLTSNRIPGIDNPRQIIRWAFDEKTKAGEVSTIFDLDNMFVIAALTKKSDKGIPELEMIKEQIEPLVRNKKKGDYLVQKMNEMDKDLQKVADTYQVEIEQLDDLNFDSRMFSGYGQENIAIGTVFTMNEGEVRAVAGSNSAFLLKLKTIHKADETDDISAIVNEQRTTFQNSIRGNASYRAIEKISVIEDNRLLFY